MKSVKVGLNAGGGDDDPASDHSCNQKIYNPLEHGDSVELAHLGFWPMSINPASSSQCQFPGVPDKGTLVYYLKNTGENGGVVIGQSNMVKSGNQDSAGSSGSQSLASGKVQELYTSTRQIRPPPQVQESEADDGTKIRTLMESGSFHSLSLLDGLPIHGALFQMTGFKFPDLKQVPTAKQHNDQMMTNQIFDQLQGQVMSLAQMFQGLMQNGSGGGRGGASMAQAGGLGAGQSYWQDIHSNLSPAMSTALNSLSNLIQGHETDNGVGYVTGGVVHYGIYLENAVQLLSQVQNMDDLMTVLSRLQWDTSIMGHDALDNVVVQIENAWGQALQEVDHNGTITVSYSNTVIQNTFTQNMTSSNYGSAATSSAPPAQGSSGSGGGSGNIGQIVGQAQSMMGNLFGQSSGTIQDMWKRLASSQEQTATQMHQKLTQQQEAQQQKQINKATTDGGDPLDKQFYVTTGQ
jgi:hypothetical protein